MRFAYPPYLSTSASLRQPLVNALSLIHPTTTTTSRGIRHYIFCGECAIAYPPYISATIAGHRRANKRQRIRQMKPFLIHPTHENQSPRSPPETGGNNHADWPD